MDIPEKIRLKNFLEKHFDFQSLKKLGFFKKGTRKTDYEIIAQRVCTFFGFESVYEYSNFDSYTTETATTINGKIKDRVNEKGELVVGGGFHLDIVETEFECPICTCKQDASEHRAYNNSRFLIVDIKCKGCKRPLTLHNDFGGNLTVSEKIKNEKK